MSVQFSRTELLLGQKALDILADRKVAVFGVGGVGGYVCEALARSGVGSFELIDHDTVSVSNINRQIIALHSTVGRLKVQVMRDRILDINPQAKVTIHPEFFLPENEDQFPFETYDYIVDAVDTVAAKIALAVKAKEMNIPIIASMGAGNKLDPTRFRVSDISKTETDPLARVIRREMKHRGITSLKVVWSDEKPIKLPEPAEPQEVTERPSGMRRATPGSVAFVPSVAGLVIAGEVIRDLVAAGEK